MLPSKRERAKWENIMTSHGDEDAEKNWCVSVLWKFLQNEKKKQKKLPTVNLYIPFDLVTLLLNTNSERKISLKKNQSSLKRISIAALYIWGENWKQPVCSKIETQLSEIWFC